MAFSQRVCCGAFMFMVVVGIIVAVVVVVVLNGQDNVPPKKPDSPTGEYNIQIVYLTDATDSVKSVINSAKKKWETLVVADLADSITIKKGTQVCGLSALEEDIEIDDLLIFVQVHYIDGVNGILGSAGPCGRVDKRIRLGVMQLDLDDTTEYESSLENVILHEIGHVLGIGTMWDNYELITPPLLSQNGVKYLGKYGNIGHVQVGGSGQAIVEDEGGLGTSRAHWKESVYVDELMTGFISGGVQPLSALTVMALEDMGYTVNVSNADAYMKPQTYLRHRRKKRHLRQRPPPRITPRPTSERIPRLNDVLQLPMIEFTNTHPRKKRNDTNT